jgi:hypothetical protein
MEISKKKLQGLTFYRACTTIAIGLGLAGMVHTTYFSTLKNNEKSEKILTLGIMTVLVAIKRKSLKNEIELTLEVLDLRLSNQLLTSEVNSLREAEKIK